MSHTALMPSTTEPAHMDTVRWRPGQQPIDLPITEEKAPAGAGSPPHNERLAKRESRLGLRSIFGRSRPARHNLGPSSQPASKQNSAPSSSSEVKTQGIPYFSLPPGKPIVIGHASRPLPATVEAASSSPSSPADVDEASKPRAVTEKSGKVGSQSWHAPPFHKACPDAAQHSNLPAPTVPADVILKAHERKAAEAALEINDEQAADKAKGRKTPRRNRSGTISDAEWTTKTYILLRSGHLLEYSNEGPFDRMPEKVLRLNRSSAAFATDLIPGRHWVLQVSSVMGAEGATMGDASRGLFSRLPFRGAQDKRHAANMLLVFESAEDMDSWLVSLRSVIESRGGKKSLTETGTPREEQAAPLREQPSQRTLLVREYDRYSRNIPEEEAWGQEFRPRASTDTHGMSATNSVVSHDGQQLDSLRSSGNRLSYVSSGQRTMVTSAGSSPACSPTTDSFPSPKEEPPTRHAEASHGDSRLRPNATAIVDRRKSLQTMSPFVVEPPPPTPAQSQRPQSSFLSAAPNFSVPHSSSRRFSTARLLSTEAVSPGPPLPVMMEQVETPALGRTPSRKPPPPAAIRTSRPLSMVQDQPSPRNDEPERPATRHGDSLTAAAVADEAVPILQASSGGDTVDSNSLTLGALDVAADAALPKQPVVRTSPGRLSSLGTLREHGEPSALVPDQPRLRPLPSSPMRALDPDRCHSSIVTSDRRKTLFAGTPRRSSKRASMVSTPSTFALPPPTAPPPNTPLPRVPPSSNRIKTFASAHALFNRRSMPQLDGAPPPLPPPTRALPPIPQKGLKGHVDGKDRSSNTNGAPTTISHNRSSNTDDTTNFF